MSDLVQWPGLIESS